MQKILTGVAFFFIFSSFAAAKGKLDVSLGYFSLDATTTRGSANVSGVGSYQIAYRTPLTTRIELLLGYSVIAAKVYTGDLGFGPDLGLIYFPITSAYPVMAKSENVSLQISEYFRPYLGAAFHQRQFQSTQSSYAGFSGIVGTEYYYNEMTSLKAEGRYIRLAGPSNGSANELDVLLGISFLF
jgi:hypothetical protein